MLSRKYGAVRIASIFFLAWTLCLFLYGCKAAYPVREPVDRVHTVPLHQLSLYAAYTLEDAVVQAAFIGVCTVDAVGRPEARVSYDEASGREVRTGAQTPLTLRVETQLKGDDTKSVTYLQDGGAYLERDGDTTTVYYYVPDPALVLAPGERALIFLDEHGNLTYGTALFPLHEDDTLDCPPILNEYEPAALPQDLQGMMARIRACLRNG